MPGSASIGINGRTEIPQRTPSTGPPTHSLLALLQALVTIGLSYQLLYSGDALLTVEARELVILGLLMIVAGLWVLPTRLWRNHWFVGMLVVGDTALTTAILYLSGNVSSDLYLTYFLILLIAALTPTLKQMIVLSIILCVGYGATLSLAAGPPVLLLKGHLLRIPVLLILATFYGVTIETLRKEYRQKVSLEADLSALQGMMEALQESEAKFRDLVANTNDIFWEADRNGVYTYCSPNVASILGYEPAELLGKTLFDCMPPEEVKRVGGLFGAIVAERKPFSLFTYTVRYKNGRLGTVERSGTPVFDKHGQFIGYRGVDQDITERKRLEEQLRQSQKMEAVGQLAGGIAHDFNNMLTAVIGYSDLLLMILDSQNPLRKHVEEIKKAGERAAALTYKLLAFSRRQVLQAEVLDINSVVTDMNTLLRRLISEDIELVTILTPGHRFIKADKGQIQQVIMNLAVNARDAMPAGGKLTIETTNVELDESYCRTHPGCRPGPYIALTIRDTGGGMDAETQRHIFEPFFTTKDVGKGTGLGLATVYGIIKQSGGYITVDSIPGRGTAFTLFLQQVDEPLQPARRPAASAALLSGYTETILLVEDDPAVRELVRNVLTMGGYTVLEAPHSEEVFRICAHHEGPIHLMVTDVVMPGMSGHQLAERLKSWRPTMKVLYISGYTDDAVVRHGVLEAGMAFLQKPFTPDIFARKVRAMLDEPH